jgi:hypothetical protein
MKLITKCLTTAFLIKEQVMVLHDEMAAGFCNKTLKYGPYQKQLTREN